MNCWRVDGFGAKKRFALTPFNAHGLSCRQICCVNSACVQINVALKLMDGHMGHVLDIFQRKTYLYKTGNALNIDEIMGHTSRRVTLMFILIIHRMPKSVLVRETTMQHLYEGKLICKVACGWKKYLQQLDDNNVFLLSVKHKNMFNDILANCVKLNKRT